MTKPEGKNTLAHAPVGATNDSFPLALGTKMHAQGSSSENYKVIPKNEKLEQFLNENKELI